MWYLTQECFFLSSLPALRGGKTAPDHCSEDHRTTSWPATFSEGFSFSWRNRSSVFSSCPQLPVAQAKFQEGVPLMRSGTPFFKWGLYVGYGALRILWYWLTCPNSWSRGSTWGDRNWERLSSCPLHWVLNFQRGWSCGERLAICPMLSSKALLHRFLPQKRSRL